MLINHLGGAFRAWRNDCFSGDNFGIYTIEFFPVDSDGDGVSDEVDLCPNTSSGDVVDADGCSINQLCPCVGPASGGTWKNHGKYVSCVAQTAEEFMNDGLITEEEKGAIVSQAAQSSCGK